MISVAHRTINALVTDWVYFSHLLCSSTTSLL